MEIQNKFYTTTSTIINTTSSTSSRTQNRIEEWMFRYHESICFSLYKIYNNNIPFQIYNIVTVGLSPPQDLAHPDYLQNITTFNKTNNDNTILTSMSIFFRLYQTEQYRLQKKTATVSWSQERDRAFTVEIHSKASFLI